MRMSIREFRYDTCPLLTAGSSITSMFKEMGGTRGMGGLSEKFKGLGGAMGGLKGAGGGLSESWADRSGDRRNLPRCALCKRCL